jgi:hypothetical protein
MRTVKNRVTPMQRLMQSAMQWTIGWAIAGVVLGVPAMLGRAIAKTGALPDNTFSFYGFWIPALGLGAAAGGLGIGVLYTGLMVLTEEWRLQFEQDTPGPKGWLLPPVICGAASGLIPGLLVGGIGGALFFALLAGCTAAGFTWWTMRGR